MPRRRRLDPRDKQLYWKIGAVMVALLIVFAIAAWSMGQSPDYFGQPASDSQ